MKNVVEQYLTHYAEPEARALLPLKNSYKHVLTVPCYSEGLGVVDFFNAPLFAHTRSVLCILVLNATPQSPAHAHAQNQLTRQALAERFTTVAYTPSFTCYQTPFGSVLLIDRACEGFYLQPHEGVGKARKIGCDVALAYIHQEKIQHPWIHGTDADALLPQDYFQNIPSEGVALLHPFEHTLPNHKEAQKALHIYTSMLHYYAQGHTYAGSPYNHISIGSTISIHAQAYAQVRGIPNRQAGEDFHVLNKLRKLGVFNPIQSQPIQLSSRLSDRVPFGTGVALKELLHNNHGDQWIHPACFVLLKTWLAYATHGLQHMWPLKQVLDACSHHTGIDTSFFKTLSVSLNLNKIWTHSIHASPVYENRSTHFHHAFDGLMTLRFLHHARDVLYGTVLWEDIQPAVYWQEAKVPETLQALPEAAQSSPGTN